MKFTPFPPIKNETLFIAAGIIVAGGLVVTRQQSAANQAGTPENVLNQATLSEIIPTQLPPATVTPSTPALFYKSSSMQDPAISAAAALVVEANTNHTVFEKNGGISWPMASITKLMTAIIASQKLSSMQAISIPSQLMPDSAQNTPATPFVPGTVFTVADLTRAMLTISSNEAAEALAASYGRTQLISDANAQAKKWGMYNTFFDDPTGLSVANQSTAHDLTILARHLIAEFPGLLALTATPKATITNIATGASIELININQFAGQSKFVGGKTGYTDEANGNLLSVFNEQGEPIITIVLGTNDRFGQTSTLLSWFEKAFTRVSNHQ